MIPFGSHSFIIIINGQLCTKITRLRLFFQTNEFCVQQIDITIYTNSQHQFGNKHLLTFYKLCNSNDEHLLVVKCYRFFAINLMDDSTNSNVIYCFLFFSNKHMLVYNNICFYNNCIWWQSSNNHNIHNHIKWWYVFCRWFWLIKWYKTLCVPNETKMTRDKKNALTWF